jgi:hypothetical protein
VYFLSLLLLLHKALFAPSADVTPFAFIAGLTGFGIVQFTYFLGRSHYNNLYHICLPLVFITTYWFLAMQRSPRHIPPLFARAVTYCFCVVTFTLLAQAASDFILKWPRSPLHALLPTAPVEPLPWTVAPSQAEVSDALALIERHAADSTRIALFLAPDLTTETLLLSQKTHVFPLSNPIQDNLLPSTRARALQFDHSMQEGDYLFITRNGSSLNRIQREILDKLRRGINDKLQQQQYGLHTDSTEHVYAISLFVSRSADSQ